MNYDSALNNKNKNQNIVKIFANFKIIINFLKLNYCKFRTLGIQLGKNNKKTWNY